MLWEYTIVQEAFESILENKKVVEIRSKKKNIKQGDYIRFHDLNSNRYIHVIVDRVESYDSIDELLERVDKNMWEFIPEALCHKFIHEEFCESKSINTVMAIYFHLSKISIVMPGYNAMPYLVETLNSIAKQVYKDYEIIYLDDNSDDNTDYIIEEFKSSLPIRYLKNYMHKGAANLRTEGLTQAKGDYIIFLDSDDLLEEEMLDEMVRTLEESDADIAIIEYDSFISSEGYRRNNASFASNPFIVSAKKRNFLWSDIPKYLIHWTNVPWNKMFRRNFLLRIDAKFQNLPCSNDVYFSHYSMCKGHLRHVNTEKALLHYRIEKKNSISSKHDYFSEIKAYQKLLRDLKDVDKKTKYKLYDDYIFGVMKYVRCGSGVEHKAFFDLVRNDILYSNQLIPKEYLLHEHPWLFNIFSNNEYNDLLYKVNYLVIYLLESEHEKIQNIIEKVMNHKRVGIVSMSNEIEYFIRNFELKSVEWIIGNQCEDICPHCFLCMTPLQYYKVLDFKKKKNLMMVETITLYDYTL